MKINVELFQKNIKKGKKLLLTKVAPIALSAGIIMGGASISAEAANVEIPVISSNSTGTDIDYSTYTSSNVTESLANQMKEIIDNIDLSYNNLYDIMASGGMNISHTKSSENSIARLLASIDEVEAKYESTISGMKTAAKTTLTKYLNSKKLEAKLLFSSLTNIELKEINDFEKNYSCVFANSVANNSLVNIGIYQIKNNQIISSQIISINDYNLNKTKSLINIPKLEVTFKSTTSSVPTFTTTYEALIISKESASYCNLAIKELDEMYEKIENAIAKGNYTKSNKLDAEALCVSIYGDTNLINETIKAKYFNVKDYQAIEKYMNYKQNLMISKVYSKNSRSINYLNYEQFIRNNEVIRISNENGYVYYKLNDKIYPVIDKGIINTYDLTNSEVSLNQLTQINVTTGLNIYVDGKLFIPTDAYGNKVDSFVWDGVAYVPLRAVSSLYNVDINWNSNTNSVYLTVKSVNTGSYYYENGKKVYLDNQLPEVPTTSAKPNTQFINKTITVSKNVKIYYEGELLQLFDSNSKPMTILVSEGTTYVPLRPIFTLFGSEVEWNQQTFSSIITRGNALVPNEKEETTGKYYKYDSNGNKTSVKEEDIDFGNTITGKPYYFDGNGNKVYLEFDKKLSLHL